MNRPSKEAAKLLLTLIRPITEQIYQEQKQKDLKAIENNEKENK